MKKRITNRLLAAVAVACLFIGGANAQILTDYVQATGIQSIDTVATGTTNRTYVLPDPVFSPGYVGAANAPIGANQRWTWSGDYTKALSADNWIEYTAGGVGRDSLRVIETNTGLACDNGGSYIIVRVIPTSTVTFTAHGGGFFGPGVGGTPYNLCETDALLGTEIVRAAFTNTGLTSNQSFQLWYTLTVDTSHSAGASWTNIPASNVSRLGSNGTQVTAINAATYDIANPAGGFVCVTDGVDYPTRYTYTISGVTDRISRKGDYLANSAAAADQWTWYDTAAETVVITVNPVPVTGPIYHISNMWAN